MSTLYSLQKLNVVKQTTDTKVRDKYIAEGFVLVEDKKK